MIKVIKIRQIKISITDKIDLIEKVSKKLKIKKNTINNKTLNAILEANCPLPPPRLGHKFIKMTE